MRCHFTTLEDGTRMFMPYCYGSLHQPDARNCCCTPPTSPRMASAEARQEIKDLRAEVARLNRIIRKLFKSKNIPQPKI
jgi:hypothetical protein